MNSKLTDHINVHVAYCSWFSWRYESSFLLALEIRGFPNELLPPWSQSISLNWVYYSTIKYDRKYKVKMTSTTLSLLFIHLLKRVWKIGRVEGNIFGKSSLNFTFGQDNYLKSDWSKAVLLEISEDWRFINNFSWHFSSCDYSISGTNPGTLPHLK